MVFSSALLIDRITVTIFELFWGLLTVFFLEGWKSNIRKHMVYIQTRSVYSRVQYLKG